MPSKFDTAIPDLVEVCEGTAGFAEVVNACVVRDLKGRVRLVVDTAKPLDLAQLATSLRNRLGGWFEGPVLNARAGTPPEKRLANAMRNRATTWPTGWPQIRTDATGADIEIGALWRGYQRVLSKQAWLDNQANSGAWPLRAQNPAILAFYSFKGGVGRSTLLGVVAWQLANAGKKVVCIDLDLEAPGLASLFDVDADGSVIDYLLTHAATGQTPTDDPVSWASVHGAQIGVIPAGRMDRNYIEKLGRLDYLGTATAAESPVAQALNILLRSIKRDHRPDYILLDCRAGIHDLGGLSLTDVAHVNILVGRDTPHGREGLTLILEVLARRRNPTAQLVLLAQTFVSVDPDAARVTQDRFGNAMYDACTKSLYHDLEEAPAVDNREAPHYPWPISNRDELANLQKLSDASLPLLEDEQFADVRSRIEALAAPEGEEPNEVGTP